MASTGENLKVRTLEAIPKPEFTAETQRARRKKGFNSRLCVLCVSAVNFRSRGSGIASIDDEEIFQFSM